MNLTAFMYNFRYYFVPNRHINKDCFCGAKIM